MKVVSRFEANLLRILHCFLRRAPVDSVLPLILNRFAQPKCLSRQAVELVQDALTKGCVHLLARVGGWRRERHLREDRPTDGRLWERSPPTNLGLEFSRHSLEFLMWITASRPADQSPPWMPPEKELTPADRFLLFLAFGALRNTDVLLDLRVRLTFLRHGLCRLAYPAEFTGVPAKIVPDFSPWTSGLGACILEAWQPELAAEWLHVERAKTQRSDWRDLQALGQAQERVLNPFFEAVDASHRWDLARFYFQVLATVLPDGVSAQWWLAGLHNAGPRLADRSETQRAALILLHSLEHVRAWERQARGIGYFDEHYGAAQLLKTEWERWQGPLLVHRAGEVLRQVDPLRSP